MMQIHHSGFLVALNTACLRILLTGESLVPSQSAVIHTLGVDSRSPYCADVELLVAVSVIEVFFIIGRMKRLLFVGSLTLDLSGMGNPTRSSRFPASIALRLFGAHKPASPPHQGGNLIQHTKYHEGYPP